MFGRDSKRRLRGGWSQARALVSSSAEPARRSRRRAVGSPQEESEP